MICFAYIVIALSGAWLLGYGFHFDPARIMHAIKHDKFAQPNRSAASQRSNNPRCCKHRPMLAALERALEQDVP